MEPPMNLPRWDLFADEHTFFANLIGVSVGGGLSTSVVETPLRPLAKTPPWIFVCALATELPHFEPAWQEQLMEYLFPSML